MCLAEYQIPALMMLTCVFTVWSNREDQATGESHLGVFFLNPLCSSLHPSLSSMQTLPHLLSFVLLLSFHHPAPVFLSQCLCQLKQPETKAELTRIRSENEHGSTDLTHTPPCLCVILSQDLLPTRPCWIPAICFTALAFKCLIEPRISWTVVECVRESRGRPRDDGCVYGTWRYACLKYDKRQCDGATN